MEKIVLLVVVVLLFGVVGSSSADWVPYGQRYAVIVMGSWDNAQQYIWYWVNTFAMYNELKTLGFADENIYFLADGDSLAVHPGVVDTTNSNRVTVQWAFDEVKSHSTEDDLLYIWWVDHGNSSGFSMPQDFLYYWRYADCLEGIKAKAIIGAYHPCNSGAVLPHVSNPGVISVSSTRADEVNSWGWAETWRRALRGGADDDPTDRNGDGHISMVEAYEWSTVRAHDHNEHPQLDDNGDKLCHGLGMEGYDPSDPETDGYIASKYALTGWWDEDTPPSSLPTALEPGSWGHIKALFREHPRGLKF